MKQLIVNADDLGADEERNAGIFEAIDAGSVTSVSILVNGPAFENAVMGIRRLRLSSISVGLHLNLSEGCPISSGMNQLTGRDGLFLGKARAQKLLTNWGDRELESEIQKELSAQLAVLKNAGIAIDHLDGHQHVHVLPAVFRVSAEAAVCHEIPWVRIPVETVEHPGTISDGKLLHEATFFGSHAQAAKPFYEAAGICMTNEFRGLYLKGRLDAAHWRQFLEDVPPGLTEFMVHPGRPGRDGSANPFAGFSTIERENELKALIDNRFHSALLEAGVTLTRFPAVQ
jgi:predicted glycoside hydrolase/deacetylase ChbG (UPF0249 family)